MGTYEVLGLPGAVAPMDCTQVDWVDAQVNQFMHVKVSNTLVVLTRNNSQHVGKEGHPTPALECVVDHTMRIHDCSKSSPGAVTKKQLSLMNMILKQQLAIKKILNSFYTMAWELHPFLPSVSIYNKVTDSIESLIKKWIEMYIHCLYSPMVDAFALRRYV